MFRTEGLLSEGSVIGNTIYYPEKNQLSLRNSVDFRFCAYDFEERVLFSTGDIHFLEKSSYLPLISFGTLVPSNIDFLEENGYVLRMRFWEILKHNCIEDDFEDSYNTISNIENNSYFMVTSAGDRKISVSSKRGILATKRKLTDIVSLFTPKPALIPEKIPVKGKY